MKHLCKAAVILTVPVFILCKTSIAQQSISTKATSMQNASLVCNVSKTVEPNKTIYAINFLNSQKSDQNLNEIDVAINLDKAIPNGTPYMIGADQMQERVGQMMQLTTGTPAKKNFSNMYVMLKLGEADYRLVGMISWNRFLCRVSAQNGLLNIKGDGDNKLISAGKTVPFDKVIVMKDASWQNLLSRYADAIVKENQIKSPPKVTWTGWSTWDYYVQKFNSQDVEINVKALEGLHVNPNTIQLDGGWWKQRGDYFDVRDDISGGIKGVIASIHSRGYKAGLHFDGFRASAASKIAHDHPEYFLHDAKGNFVELGQDVVSKDPLIIWDYSHPGALAYMRSVMKNARDNWKVDYFKIDFMRQGLTKGISHLPLTAVERFRMGVKALKEGMGSNIYFLGCSSNFGTLVGLVDGNRMGADIQPTYQAVRSRAMHSSASYYMQGKIWNVDPDYLVVRNKDEMDERGAKKPSLTYNEAAMWANYVSVYGNARFDSDNITLLKPEKKQLIQSCMAKPFFTQIIPMDIWAHNKTETDAPCFYLAKNDKGAICIGLFNWDNADAKFTITGFKQNAQLKSYSSADEARVVKGQVTTQLKGVHSMLWEYKGNEPFEVLSKQLSLTVAVN